MTEIILVTIISLFCVAEVNMLIYFMRKEVKRIDEQERVKGTYGTIWR